ncbi:hypothetical protein QEN19_001527 [Hanseniaspora menglaensis]
MIFKTPFLTIVFLFSLISSVFGAYYNSSDLTTTVTSKITMYITLGSETYTVLKTPLMPSYAINSTAQNNGTVNSAAQIPISYLPTTTLSGNSTKV